MPVLGVSGHPGEKELRNNGVGVSGGLVRMSNESIQDCLTGRRDEQRES